MKKVTFIILATLFFIGCDDRLEDLNTDKRNPAEVDPSSLFTQGLRETFDLMSSISVNDNPFNLYAQYWAQTTYPDESQYNMVGRSIPRNFWRTAYRNVLNNLKESKRLIQEELESGTSVASDAELMNRMATIDILTGYVYHVLVDAFGDIPYTEALDPENLNPKYDDAREVYNSVIANLSAALATIDQNIGGFPASQDPLYNGDMTNWVKLANSVKLRMGMRLADVDKAASVNIVNEALAAGVISSNAENASMPYGSSAPNTNPVYEDLVLSGRQDFVASNTLVDVMNDLEDPRRPVYFRENVGPGTFIGGIYGDANSYSEFTQVGNIFHQNPDFPGTIFNYAEVEFLMAEAIERGGYNVTGTVEEHYNAGIMASFDQWGLPMSAYEAYIMRPEVQYTTAPGEWQQKIGLQLWLALYTQGFEGWNTWRRLDFAAFNAPPEMTIEDIPVRFTYPLEEAQLNGPAYNAAGSKIGGDNASTRVFWDVK